MATRSAARFALLGLGQLRSAAGHSAASQQLVAHAASFSAAAGGEGAMAQPTNRVSPAKKMVMLKVLSTPRRKLAAQGGRPEMLPPGCSISDPSDAYTVKEPVYFQDPGTASDK